jgi:hypothetical protein
MNDALAIMGDIGIVGNHDQGYILFFMQAAQNIHYFFAGFTVQITGWLICQDNRRVLARARATATLCCSPPESSFGRWCMRSDSPTFARLPWPLLSLISRHIFAPAQHCRLLINMAEG